jgi:hypothetical protein
VLTLGSGKMSNVADGTLSVHHILEVGGKISGTMRLEQVVEQDWVVCSVCVSHKTKLSDGRAGTRYSRAAGKVSNRRLTGIVLIRLHR